MVRTWRCYRYASAIRSLRQHYQNWEKMVWKWINYLHPVTNQGLTNYCGAWDIDWMFRFEIMWRTHSVTKTPSQTQKLDLCMCLLWAPVSLSGGRNSSCHLKCINIDLVLVVFHCLVKLFHIFFVVTQYALAGTVSKRYIFLKYSYLLLYTSDIKSTYVKRFVMKDVIGSEYIFFHARFSEMFSRSYVSNFVSS